MEGRRYRNQIPRRGANDARRKFQSNRRNGGAERLNSDFRKCILKTPQCGKADPYSITFVDCEKGYTKDKIAALSKTGERSRSDVYTRLSESCELECEVHFFEI